MAMNVVSFLILLWIVLLVIQVLMTGQFMKHLERDNKPKYDEVWSGSELMWNYIHPLRIGLLYALPGTFELWGLSEEGLRSARRLRVVSIFSALALLGVAAALIIEYIL
jgi:hypothetical protein